MLLVSFLLISLIGSALAVPQHNVGYFAGRSGNIIVQPENAIHDNSALLLHGNQFDNIELKSIEDVSVADLFAHVMGTQPFNVLADRNGFPQGDLFNKPKAIVMFALDSVNPDVYAKYSVGKDYSRVGITTSTYPANSNTILSNLATGAQPSVHGVVADSWVLPNGEKVSADSQGSLAANIADILTQEWAGASLTVSASASATLASAFAVNKQFAGDNTYALSMDSGVFDSLYLQHARPLALTEKALQTIFQDAAFFSFLGATNNQFTITVSSKTATFDLTQQEDYNLFAELGFVYNLLNVIGSDSKLSALVADAVPDFYSFVFSGLKGLKEKHGEESDVFIVALALVDNAIQQAVAKFDKLYDGRVVSAVAVLNTQTVVSDELKKIVYDTTKSYLQNKEDFALHFPSLYVSGNSGRACNNLKNAVGSAAEVHCFTATYYNFADYSVILGNSTGNGTGNTTVIPGSNAKDPSTFWILFFLPFGILCAILVGIFALMMAGSDASKDSLLFRSAGRAHAH